MKPLERIFGGKKARMLDFLITMREFEYSFDELINKCGIDNNTTARNCFRYLFGEELIIVSTKHDENGRYLYSINTHKADGLIKYFDQYIEEVKMQMEGT
jgi:hypothetical protein